MSNDPQQEQTLLQQLRASGDPDKQQEAAQLQKLYHDRQMGDLATDAYAAAKGADKPPPGWIRVSDDPGKYAPQLHMTAFELRRALHPDHSGFRAEIYLPDPKVLGPGYKPVVAFKGSSGEVMTSDGKLHDTTKEDFLANNFPQSVGMETDYYDRAMKLAIELKRGGLQFELTGHSLSGGMASAASAVTGYPATTWNAAGLNPETARRFGEQNDLPVYNNEQLKPLITAYQVQGELLSDGVQGNIHRMDVIQRAEVGGLLKETSQLLNALPQGRDMLKEQLTRGTPPMPPEAQAKVHAFVDNIATGNTDQMLRDLPLAAGTVQPPLVAMARRDPDDPSSPLVPRAQTLSLTEVTTLAGPVLETLSIAAAGAHVGERTGEVVAYGGQATGQVLQNSGAGIRSAAEFGGQVQNMMTRIEGAVAQKAEHYVGAAAARTIDTGSKVLAGTDEGLGWARQLGASVDASLLRSVGSVLPEGAQKWMNQQATQIDRTGEEIRRETQAQAAGIRHEGQAGATAIRGATQFLEKGTGQAAGQVGNFQHDAIAGTGRVVGGTLDATGQIVENTSRQAPAVGAGIGAWMGLNAAAGLELNPASFPRLAGAAEAIAQGKPAADAALGLHLMKTSVLPSLDARIEEVEKTARQSLERTAAPPAISEINRQPAQSASSEPDKTTPEQQKKNAPKSDIDKMFERLYQGAVNRDAKEMNAAAQDYLRTPHGQGWQQHGIQNDQANLAAQHQAGLDAQQRQANELAQQQAAQKSQGMGR
ncbi:hypothetical protein [Rhodanobacter sp. L36]|uniref:hypothetical protein n=1 Tax=Rhodanobacter sp. L36 TaxID=1747221 RepID=UPI00131ABDF8|nr:hypothetical protein [Rhodanobacter sp. L36]